MRAAHATRSAAAVPRRSVPRAGANRRPFCATDSPVRCDRAPVPDHVASRSMVVIRSHDALFRFVFGEPEQIAELLGSTLPSVVRCAIDWGSLRNIGGSFVDAELRERHA